MTNDEDSRFEPDNPPGGPGAGMETVGKKKGKQSADIRPRDTPAVVSDVEQPKSATLTAKHADLLASHKRWMDAVIAERDQLAEEKTRAVDERDDLLNKVAELERALKKQQEQESHMLFQGILNERSKLAAERNEVHSAQKQLEKRELELANIQAENESKLEELAAWDEAQRVQRNTIEEFLFDNRDLSDDVLDGLSKAAFEAGQKRVARDDASEAAKARRELQARNKAQKKDEEHLEAQIDFIKRLALDPSKWHEWAEAELKKPQTQKAKGKGSRADGAEASSSQASTQTDLTAQGRLHTEQQVAELTAALARQAYGQGSREAYHEATLDWAALPMIEAGNLPPALEARFEHLRGTSDPKCPPKRALDVGEYMQTTLLAQEKGEPDERAVPTQFSTADMLPPPGLALSKDQKIWFTCIARGALKALGVDAEEQYASRERGVKSAELLTQTWTSRSSLSRSSPS